MTEFRVDMRKLTDADRQNYRRQDELIFKLNHTLPTGSEYLNLLNELFADRIGAGSFVKAPIAGAAFDEIKIGKSVYVNSNLLAMARGGITIEDDVQIAANVQLITNNHDPYDRQVLTCKPIVIKRGAWIGAGATILPGVTIGKYAIVGAASVVTRDVGDFEIVVGNPAKLIKTLDKTRFAADD